MKKIQNILALIIILMGSCVPRGGEAERETEALDLYSGRDTLLPGEQSVRMMAFAERAIEVPAGLDLEDKVRLLADSVSAYYFNGLEIAIRNLEAHPEHGLLLVADLLEPDGYQGPGLLPSYQSWYDFFQGSSGGQNTSIILRNTFLQPRYQGEWVDAVMFYYQGEPFPAMDHVFLEGIINN